MATFHDWRSRACVIWLALLIGGQVAPCRSPRRVSRQHGFSVRDLLHGTRRDHATRRGRLAPAGLPAPVATASVVHLGRRGDCPCRPTVLHGRVHRLRSHRGIHTPAAVGRLRNIAAGGWRRTGAPRPRRRRLPRVSALGAEHGWGCPVTSSDRTRAHQQVRNAFEASSCGKWRGPYYRSHLKG
jgi:hypothetical protein